MIYSEDTYHYEIGFVTSGNYSIVFSCESEDQLEEDDGFVFIAKQEIIVTSEDLQLDFPAYEE